MGTRFVFFICPCKVGKNPLRLQVRQTAGGGNGLYPSVKMLSPHQKPSRDIPVSTLIWTRSVPPHAAAAALYSSALARADTVWVIW